MNTRGSPIVRLLLLFGVLVGLILILRTKFTNGKYDVNLPKSPTVGGYTPQHYVESDGLPWSSKACKKINVKKWYSQRGEDKYAQEKFYHNKVCKGTFVEIGAFDGVRYSISKAYEDSFQWDGLLIEADPDNFAKLEKNRPNIYKIRGATCFENETEVSMTGGGTISALQKNLSPGLRKFNPKLFEVNRKVPCQPLYRMLSRARLAAVDLFVLDVEDSEFEVLKTMNWSVPVGFWIIELPGRNKVKDAAVRALMAKHGYIEEPSTLEKFGNTGFVHPLYRQHMLRLGV